MGESADVVILLSDGEKEDDSDIVLISDDMQSEADSDNKGSILFPVLPAKRYSHQQKYLGLHLQVKIQKRTVLVTSKGMVACFNTSYRINSN